MIGIIAGEGSMPRALLKTLQERGLPFFLIRLKGVSDSLDAPLAQSLYITQLGKAIRLCKKQGVQELYFAGRVPHQKIFSLATLHTDWKACRLLLSLPDYRGDSILRAIAEAFTKEGILIGDSTKYLQGYLAQEGLLTRVAPTKEALEEAAFAIPLVRQLASLNIGQTVVVKKKSVVAVEAMEGTDQCLQRAFEVAGQGCVVVKGTHPAHDMRFDVPVIGVNTIEKLQKIKASLLVIEATKTLVLDPEAIALAERFKIPLLAARFEEANQVAR